MLVDASCLLFVPSEVTPLLIFETDVARNGDAGRELAGLCA